MTDAKEILQGLKRNVPDVQEDVFGHHASRNWNAAIARAIEIVENHGKK